MTDDQFNGLIEGLKAFVSAGETGNLRQAFADLRTWVDAVTPANPVSPPAIDPLPTGFDPGGLADLGSAPAESAPDSPALPIPAPPEPPGGDVATLIPRYANLPQGEQQVRMMQAWVQCEGGESHNNPLNVAAPTDGSWSYTGQTGFWNNLGSMGVVTFDTMQDGCAANARILQQQNMGNIYASLAAGDSYRFVTALGTDPWGTSPECVASILGVQA